MLASNYRRWRRIIVWSSLLILFMFLYPFIEEILLQEESFNLFNFFLDIFN